MLKLVLPLSVCLSGCQFAKAGSGPVPRGRTPCNFSHVPKLFSSVVSGKEQEAEVRKCEIRTGGLASLGWVSPTPLRSGVCKSVNDFFSFKLKTVVWLFLNNYEYPLMCVQVCVGRRMHVVHAWVSMHACMQRPELNVRCPGVLLWCWTSHCLETLFLTETGSSLFLSRLAVQKASRICLSLPPPNC